MYLIIEGEATKTMPKFGLKTLVVSAITYLVFSAFWLNLCFEMATEPDSLMNLLALIGFAAHITLTLFLVKPFRKLWQNAKVDINQMLGGVGIVLLALYSSGCVERIEPGYAGIKVNLSGSDKGVSDVPLVTGWVFYNPLFSQVLEYPTFVQTVQWTKSEEDDGKNEEITFNSVENMSVSVDVSLSYYVEREKVPEFYVKFRSDDLRVFTHGFMRNSARDALNEVGGRYSIEDLLGPKKEAFISEVQTRINEQTSKYGVVIEQFGFIGAPRPPESVIKAINDKIAATQAAIKSENELRQAQAEAKKAIAKAEGEAQSQIARAEGEAQANKILLQSITPTLLEWRRLSIQEQAVQRWDGRRPTVEGVGSGMLLQIDTK